ncbi:DNA-binding protein [Streptomyces sp. ms191]|uniref:helix-turn-helix transcriptional regulator n=1 Tax=Streptomyces sp. ms191 TaxID=1827978 RepID=UPI0011CE51CE|nr:DNA-binding protein [Streptomyces sp. ms191]TXS08250.1 DNA-binding protein [Streptomyces sp. ms191]
MSGEPALVDEEAAAYYVGRPGSTIRRWATEGRIKRYRKPGSRAVRYDVWELNAAIRDEDTSLLLKTAAPPPLPHAA